MNRARKEHCCPLNAKNLERYFNTADAVLNLRLKKWQWRRLFHHIDRDGDRVIGEDDFVALIDEFGNAGRVVKKRTSLKTTLLSNGIFRRADEGRTGLLDSNRFEMAAKMARADATPDDIRRAWQTYAGHKGYVDAETFAKFVAAPPEEAWQLTTMQVLSDMLAAGTAKMQTAFAATGSITGMLTPNEFRDSMRRVGIALSSNRCGALFNLIDVHSSGAVSFDDIVNWVTGVKPVLKLASYRERVCQLVALHLGSAENFFRWIQKKLKLHQRVLAMNLGSFQRGVELLCKLGMDESYDLLEAVPADMFEAAGGRNGTVSFQDFISYFTLAQCPTVASDLPACVDCIARHKTAIGNRLTKLAPKGTIEWDHFRQEIEISCADDVALGEPTFFPHLRLLADPFRIGVVNFKPLLNRCRWRKDSLSTSSLRRSGRAAAASATLRSPSHKCRPPRPTKIRTAMRPWETM
jgi:Ca2+-binding EF-hand superfamily protein